MKDKDIIELIAREIYPEHTIEHSSQFIIDDMKSGKRLYSAWEIVRCVKQALEHEHTEKEETKEKVTETQENNPKEGI